MRRIGAWLLIVVAAWIWTATASAQFVSGEWVARSDANIEQHRKKSVSFLVLDAQGRLAADASVRLEQLNHAFSIGFLAHGGFPDHYDATAEGWRAFNAISLAPMTSWRRLQPDDPGTLRTEDLAESVARAKAAGLRLRWGALASADTFDWPEWAVPLRGQALGEALRHYVEKVGERFGETIDDFDLAAQTRAHDRLSPAMLRLLALDAAMWSRVTPRLSYESALWGPRHFEAVEAMDGVLKQRLNINAFSVKQVFPPRPIAQDLLEPAVKRLAKFGRPLTVGSLEVGGSNAIEVAVNAETVLRTLFAEPAVDGVYFAGVYPDDFNNPSAALFDEDGQVTPIARTADRLFRETWWSDATVRTNELGETEARVFLGDYRVTATLADGSSVSIALRLDTQRPNADAIVLMPIGADE